VVRLVDASDPYLSVVASVSAVFLNPLTLDAQRELMRLASYVVFITSFSIGTRLGIVLKVLMASTIAVAIFGLWQALAGGYSALYDVLYPVQEKSRRYRHGKDVLLHFLNTINGLAGYINLVMPFCLAFATSGSDPLLRTLSRWCLVLAGIALLLTQSRGGLIAFASILLINACLSARDRNTRIRRVAIVLVVCLIATAAAGVFFQRLGEIDDFTTVSRLAIWVVLSLSSPTHLYSARASESSRPHGGLLNLPDGWTGDCSQFVPGTPGGNRADRLLGLRHFNRSCFAKCFEAIARDAE